MRTYSANITRNHLIIGGVALTLLVGYVLFFRGGGETVETLAVAKGDFVQQVSVSGKVVPAQDVDLGFAQSGRVTGVYVSTGDRVGAGTALAQVENGDLRAAVLQKQAALENQEAKLRSLKLGTLPEEIAVTESTVENDTVALAQADQSLLNSILNAYTVSDDAVRNTVDLFLSNARGTNPQLVFQTGSSQYENAVESGRVGMESLLTDWQTKNAGLSASMDLAPAVLSAHANLGNVSSFLADANGALNQAVMNPSVSQSNINGWIADVATARKALDTALSSLTSADTSRKSALATLEKDKRTLALQRAGATPSDIAAQEAQVKSAQAELDNARAQLEKTIIRAPFGGIVSRMELKAGEIVSASDEAKVSMASDGLFQIESFVPEVNIALIARQNPAEVTLDAYGDAVTFSAVVISVDPAETIRDGVSTYKVVLQFNERDERVRSGMTANVRITTAKMQNVISVPQGIVVGREGKKYVPVVDGEDIALREVTTGQVSSLGNIEILSGLAEGDTVVLSR
jgi:HlyD family secretion protein